MRQVLAGHGRDGGGRRARGQGAVGGEQGQRHYPPEVSGAWRAALWFFVLSDSSALKHTPPSLQLRQPKGETRDISQYHYTAWPDHGVPDSPHSLMSMLGMIRDEQPTNDVPLVIHCSAGVGRTGAFFGP